MTIWGLGGGGGVEWPINNQTGSILLPCYRFTYINIHINQSDKSNRPPPPPPPSTFVQGIQ